MKHSFMKSLINSTFFIVGIDFDSVNNEAQVCIVDASKDQYYIANYDILGSISLHYDLCGSGEAEVSLYDTDLVFLDVVGYESLEEVYLPDLNIKKVTSLLEDYIIEVLEQERQDNLGDY